MNVRRKMSIIVLSLMTTGIFAGCAGGQLSQDQQHNSTIQTGDSINKEAELQAEIDALREELDELKNNQADQVRGEDTAGQTDQGNTSQNKAINSENPSSKGNSSSSNAVISIEEAKSIALARVPGATEKNMSIELDNDDGWSVYEGEIMYDGMEYEFDIDANSGTILKWEEERW